jgi:hypothetical protein
VYAAMQLPDGSRAKHSWLPDLTAKKSGAKRDRQHTLAHQSRHENQFDAIGNGL